MSRRSIRSRSVRSCVSLLLSRTYRRMKDSEHPCNIPPRDAFGDTFLFPADSIPCREAIVPGRVAPGDCSPGAPADPYLHFRAYGSSYHELATRWPPEEIRAPSRTRLRDRCWFLYTVMGFDAFAMCSSNGVMTWRPLLSTGSLGMVPPLQRYHGTLRLPAVRLDPFDVFTSRYHRVARGLLPSVVGVPPGARELSVPVSPSGLTMETSGSLSSLFVDLEGVRERPGG